MAAARLVPLAENLWSAEATLSMPGGVRFPLRMTVARLATGGLWVHSPIALDAALESELAELGVVSDIVAPNCFHNLYAGAWAARYPEATLHAAPGFAEKKRDVRVGATLSDDANAWRDDFDFVLLAGAPKAGEVVFVHRPSASLIVTDLVFNIQPPVNFATRLVLRLGGTHKGLAASRLWNFITKDRARFAESLDRVLAHDFDRLVPAHGAVVEGGARDALAAALHRFVGADRGSSQAA